MKSRRPEDMKISSTAYCSNLAFLAYMALGTFLNRAFELTHEIGYLNEAISSTRHGINAVDSPRHRVSLVYGLTAHLSVRLELRRHEDDLHELMQLFHTVASSSHDLTFSHGQLPSSLFWATTARRFGHPSASTAYDHAMSWMQASLTFAPTLDKQHSGKPFDSSFKLYQGKRLSLIDIVRSRLPNAEFAFLTACHTAELTDESPADVSLHLAAAMQYCGSRSIVGTMWAMADEDGQDLAENFYKSVFSGWKQGAHYNERTAEALRDAVLRLQRKKGIGTCLERWVNYVHYGA